MAPPPWCFVQLSFPSCPCCQNHCDRRTTIPMMRTLTTAKMMVMIVTMVVTMMIGTCASTSYMGVRTVLFQGCSRPTCPEIRVPMDFFLQKGLNANAVPTGSEQTQFQTQSREKTYGTVFELGMVCGGISEASGVSQSVQEYACQSCPFSRVCATAYLHTPCDRLPLSAVRQGN